MTVDTRDPAFVSEPLASDLPIPFTALHAAAARLRPDLAPPALVQRALHECLAEPRWSYHYAPSLRGQEVVLTIHPSRATLRTSRKPPRPYEASPSNCTCKGSFVRGCKHPAAALIVAEALEPTTSVLGRLPFALLCRTLALAQTIGTPSMSLVADSGTGTLAWEQPGVAQVVLTLDLLPDCRAAVRSVQQLAMEDIARLLAALAHDPPADDTLVDVEVADGSLTLCIWNGSEIIWYDGAVLTNDADPA